MVDEVDVSKSRDRDALVRFALSFHVTRKDVSDWFPFASIALYPQQTSVEVRGAVLF